MARSFRRRGTLALAAALCAGCSSAPERRLPPPPSRPLPCVVRVVLPAPGDELAPGELRLDALNVERELGRASVEARLATAISVVSGDAAVAADGADIELRLACRTAPSFSFSRRNGWFLPNTLLWFFGGFPSFWVADRAYQIQWDAELRFLCAATGDQIGGADLSLRRELALSIIDRGWTAEVLYTPPGFYEGPTTAAALQAHVEAWLVGELASQLAGHAGKLRAAVELDVATADAGQGARIVVRSPTVLERLRLELDRIPIYEKDPLTMIKAARSRDGRWEYDVQVPLRAGPGEHVLRAFALRHGESAARPPADGARWSATRTVRFTTPERG